MSEFRKRKRHGDRSNRRQYNQHDHDYQSHTQSSDQDPALYIQAHEADLHRGPQARELARSLEVASFDAKSSASAGASTSSKIGSALILWAGGSGSSGTAFDGDQDDTINLGQTVPARSSKGVEDASGIWVDRYDARLLLDALPDLDSSTVERPSTPSGWSDLPSDTEDTFFFSPEEAEDYRHEKRRRLLEQAHEDRVRARMEEEREELKEEIDDDPWGGSDEEPDDTQKDLMRRTAAHLLSSPNPAQLEMRILANHGADKRFAFLKGRWSLAWQLIKFRLRKEQEEKEQKEKQEKEKGAGLGMLAGYDSDSENGSDDAENGREPEEDMGEADVVEPDQLEEAKKKELRRQKAKEWAERRRAEADAADILKE